jgi:hypothetical protein
MGVVWFSGWDVIVRTQGKTKGHKKTREKGALA